MTAKLATGFLLLTLSAQGALAADVGRKNLQVFNDVSSTVNRYERFTIFDDVSAAVKDGVVTLNGEALHQPEKDGADNVTRLVGGVKSVVNNLKVKPEEPKAETKKPQKRGPKPAPAAAD